MLCGTARRAILLLPTKNLRRERRANETAAAISDGRPSRRISAVAIPLRSRKYPSLSAIGHSVLQHAGNMRAELVTRSGNLPVLLGLSGCTCGELLRRKIERRKFTVQFEGFCIVGVRRLFRCIEYPDRATAPVCHAASSEPAIRQLADADVLSRVTLGSLVQALGVPRCPPDISRFVTGVIVDAINGVVLGGAWPQLFDPLLEAREVKSYASSTVILVVTTIWSICTALLGIIEGIVQILPFRGSCAIPMGDDGPPQTFIPKTPAT